MERAAEAMNKLGNNPTLMNVLLSGCFGLLCMKSLHQQHQIAALEAEKEAIATTNKNLKKTLWDWKHHLLTEAESPNPHFSVSTIRAIYGDAGHSSATVLNAGDAMQTRVEKPQTPRLLI